MKNSMSRGIRNGEVVSARGATECYTRDDDEFLYQDPTYYTEVMKTISLIAKIIWCQQWKARTDVNTQRKLTKLTEVILQ